VKKLLLIISLTLTTKFVFAQGSALSLQLPGMPQSYGQDSIRAGELHCQNAIGGSTSLEFGVTGVIDNYQSPFGNKNNDPSNRNIGVYGRIVIPIDGPERINCNSLYELELRKKRLEVLRLQEEIDTLKRLNANGGSGPKFEN
jgi:hypothetical protein